MFDALKPYRLLLEALLIAAVVAFIGLEIHRFLEHERGIGRAEVQARWDAQKAADVQAAAAKKQEDDKRSMEANNAATLRDQQLQALASALTNTSSSLRDTIAAKRAGLGAASADANRATADAALAVFGDCKERYGALAAVADRHVSDVKTLTDAWPR